MRNWWNKVTIYLLIDKLLKRKGETKMNLLTDVEKVVEILLSHIAKGNQLEEIRKILEATPAATQEVIQLVNSIKQVLNK